MIRTTLAALLAPALAAAVVALADLDRPFDVLELANGKKIEGHVLRVEPAEVLMLVDTRHQAYAKDKVERVRSPIPHLAELARRLDGTPAGDAAANVALAAWCDEQDMPYEADFLRWRAIAADWGHAPAHEALGHRQRSDEWQVKAGKSWMDQKRFEGSQEKFRSAFQVETALFQVKGNVPLSKLCEMAVDATRFYAAFFELFGDVIGMPHASQWMAIHLHGDDDSFPRVGAGDAEYFLAEDNRVVVDTTRLSSKTELRRALLRQALYSTYRNAENGQGSAPAWLSEALGVYLSAALGDGGAPDPARALHPERDWFAIHAQAEEAESLSRILNADADELRNVPGYELRMAQAYTLLDWCLNGDEGAHRDDFIRYVQGTMHGQVSPTHFQDALGVENRDFEKAWSAWAAKRAEQRARASGAASADGEDDR